MNRHTTTTAALIGLLLVLGLVPLARNNQDRGLSVTLPSDESEIVLLLSSLERTARTGKQDRLQNFFPPTDKRLEQKTDGLVSRANPTFILTLKNITIQNDIATATCDLEDYSGRNADSVRIILKKTGFKWQIQEAERLVEYLRSSINEKNEGKKPNEGDPALFSPVGVTTSSRVLVPVKHPGTSVFLLNRGLSETHLGRQLFSPDAVLSMDAVIPDVNAYEIGFMCDRYWDRIIFGKQEPGHSWIRSYGDNPGDSTFSGPHAITIDPYDTIFVADTYNRRIVKLFFNRVLNTVSWVRSLSAPAGITFPTDISYDQNAGLPCLPGPSVGCLWIVDETNGTIVRVNRQFEVEKTITHYTYASVTYRLQHPRSIVSSMDGYIYQSPFPLLGVIDGDRNAFVTLNTGNVTNGTVAALNSSEFDLGTSELTCVGIDWFRQFWVGDKARRMYHTFSDEGEYLSSIEADAAGTMLFPSPSSISRTQQRFSGSCTSIFARLNIVTADRWGATTGLRNFFPGADAVNLSATRNGSNFDFRWTLTNRESVMVQVVNEANSVVYPISNPLYPFSVACVDGRSVSASDLPYGYLRLRVKVRPYYDSIYTARGYGQGWLTREIQFTNELSSPANVTATGYPGNIKLSWSAIPGVTGYQIERDAGEFFYTTATSYWDNYQIVPGQTYSYKVKAYSGSYYGPASTQVTAQATHLQSVSSSAISINSQRKMAAIKGSGSDPDRYFTAYESNGEVFATMSTNQGGTWSIESRGSAGWGTGSAPSIATWIAANRSDKHVYCAYREGTYGHWDIWMIPFHEHYGYGFHWNPASYVGTVNFSVDARPVVARTFGMDLGQPRDERLVVAWEYENGIAIRELKANPNDPESSQWIPEETTHTIDGPYHHPSISVNPLEGLANPPTLLISFDDNNDVFIADPLYPAMFFERVPASIAPQSYSAQIAGETDGWYSNASFHFVWEAIHSGEQQTDGGGTWAGGDAVPQRRKVM